jgi:hypothetical protein
MSACLDKNNIGACFSKRDGLRLANTSCPTSHECSLSSQIEQRKRREMLAV